MTRPSSKVSMDALASLCKRRGFIFQSSELYDGLNGFWDYGPLGCELKRNIREAWWCDMVRRRENVVGLDTSIIMHPKVWEASGHVAGFADPMVDCKACRKRYRADTLCEEQGAALVRTGSGFALPPGMAVFTVATMMSPTLPYFRPDPPSTRMQRSSRAPVLSATLSLVSC